MTETLLNFFYMGGHGFYVWFSYGIVLTFLGMQWFLPWRRWRKYLREQFADQSPEIIINTNEQNT